MTGREKKLIDALTLALHALNEVPNFAVRHEKYRNSYDVAKAIGKALREIEGAGDDGDASEALDFLNKGGT